MAVEGVPPALRPAVKALLRERRESRGLSRRQVARKLGRAVKTLEEWERPGGPCPGCASVIALAKLLGSPDMLTLLVADVGWVVVEARPPAGTA